MNHKRVVILTPRSMSVSAKKLQQALKVGLPIPVILVSPYSKTYQGRHSDYVINWGYSKQTEFIHNKNDYWKWIDFAVNKLKTFVILDDNKIPIVDYTAEKDTAQGWLNQGHTVIARATLNGFGGQGIDIITPDMELPNAVLYTIYKKKKHEFRVHVIRGEVVDVTQKKKRKNTPIDTKIRNFKNGWVYCRSDIHISDALKHLALNAVEALNLEHGAVDIIWNELLDKYFVLEINTAPGLVGTTLETYTNAFIKDILK